MSASLIAIVLLLCYPLFAAFLRPSFSPHRQLPCARQCFSLLRFFHEPSTFEIAEWVQDMPNERLIRYFGFLNQERLLINDSDATRQVLLREASKYKKISALAALQIGAGVSGLVAAEGDLHKYHRRHTIAAFNSSVIHSLFPTIWKSVKNCTEYFAKDISQSPAGLIRINRFMQAACLDIAGPANFGLDMNILSHPEQKLARSYLKPFQIGKFSPLFLKLLQIPPASLQGPLVFAVKKYILRIDTSAMKFLIHQTLKTKLEAARDGELRGCLGGQVGEKRIPDVLDGLVRRARNHISERAILKHAMTVVAACLEMVSNQLSWAIYALSHPMHQHIQDRLRNDIRDRFPYPPETITWEDISSLPYLMGTVNEILRLYPGVAHRWRVCTMSTTLLGQIIPKGTILTWPIYATNRSTVLWGEDANDFRPERWFEPVKRDSYAFMTFGQGPRKCPGEHYTRAVVACQLVSLIGRFKFKMPGGGVDIMEHEKGKAVKFGIVMKADIYAEVEEVPS